MKPYVITYNKLFWLGVVIIFHFSLVRAQYDFGFTLDSEIAHPTNEGAIATESQSIVTIEQNWVSKDRKMKALLQARLMNYSYEFEKVRYQSSELFPADFYFEFLPASQKLTIGYQHLFLIDGFDTVGMELINPNNESISFFSNADKKFYTLPAVNYRWIGDNVTFQAFATLKGRSDEPFTPFIKELQNSNPFFQYEKIPTSDLYKKNDLGIRVQTTLKAVDVSFSWLRTFEKSNSVMLDLSKFKIMQKADPFTSYLMSLSGDISGWVLRFDYLENSHRNTTLTNFEYLPLSYRNINFGIEHDFLFSSSIALNFSQSKIMTENGQEPLFRKATIEDFYLRLSKKFSNDLDSELLFLQRTSDGGRAINLKIIYPMSPIFNVKAGIEAFDGKETSQFKMVKDLSRIYVGINSTVF